MRLENEVRMSISIDAMRGSDWERVREIYLDGLATGQASFETEAPGWEQWDEAHCRHSRLAARENGRLIGWAALAPMSWRRCYAGVAEVSLYVSAAARGRGVGKRLLEELVASSERNGIWTLYGSTFPENEASLRVQLACGFRIVGRRKRIAQHHGVWRDTVITERRSQMVGI
jgi:phosphinothricin acetyltransferase